MIAKLAIKEHLKADFNVRPLVAELFLTDNCNLKCVSCACWRSVTRSELSTDEWREVISQLAEAGILKANFTGGEPLLRRDAPVLMAHARHCGIRDLHLNTNATLLTQERLDQVLDAGVRSFNISVDGSTAEMHDEIRGAAGAFAKTQASLERVIQRRDELHLRVRMNFTVMRSNISELPDMIRLAQKLRVRLYLNLATDQTFLFRDGQVSIESKIAHDDIDEAMSQVEAVVRQDPHFAPRYSELAYLPRHFTDVLQPSVPCTESQMKLMIHSTGEIGGCWGHDAANNVRETPVSEVLASQHYREEHARFFKKECRGCGSNYALNLSWRPSTYYEDLMWRIGRRSLAHPQTAGEA